MPIDYSKWDNVYTNSDNESTDSQRKPRVTTFAEPQSITITAGNREMVLAHKSKENCNTTIPTRPIPLRPLDIRQPKNGAIMADYAWEQDQSQIYFWFKLPHGALCHSRRPERQVKLLLDRPPPALNPPILPEAVIASDFNESKDDADEVGLFPVAWGVKIYWPVEIGTCVSMTKSTIWDVKDESDRIISKALWFFCPVMRGDSTWLWSVEDNCPFFSPSSQPDCFVKLEMHKKKSQSLHNISIMWEKGLLTEENSIQVQRSAEQRARHDAFRKAWTDAHEEFKKRVKTREANVIEI